jgi:hypothetical protein
MAKTMKDLAKEALAVQDACNLSGVAQGFARAMLDLRDHVTGSKESAGHCITIVWLDKLNSLAGIQDLGNDKVMQAFRDVDKLARS